MAVSYGGNTGRVAVFAQLGDGTLAVDPIAYRVTDIPNAVELGDVNGDGKDDVLVQHDSFMTLSVLTQNEHGLLNEAQRYDFPWGQHLNEHAMSLGDLNSDGCTDVAIANHAGNDEGLVVFYHV
ncbi:MAG: FG-GAP repeat protein [Parcubacteria group bacterium GW2011_GWF2_38_8]|nr:MAG: FG-GAP repeat protein [Parcubacteria group bacterium GW2011_GWF2_38_8]HIG95757.1 VCBS repeat-containing protein [Candidatus Woesearchaeota archaeon]HIH47046.1 VCBS repeat-containing protein [Candidatus Woesearchaeota archaeon]HII88536.1 VCBS repeat-containing protein [Candidatus Woesearchaeota archaeon]